MNAIASDVCAGAAGCCGGKCGECLRGDVEGELNEQLALSYVQAMARRLCLDSSPTLFELEVETPEFDRRQVFLRMWLNARLQEMQL